MVHSRNSASFRSRPHGPRPQSPKPSAKSPPANIMDLTSRFDEASPAYSSHPRPSSSTPSSPFFSTFLHNPSAPPSSYSPQSELDPASPPYSSPRSSFAASVGTPSPFNYTLPFRRYASSDSRLSLPSPSATSDGMRTPVSDRPTSSSTLVSAPVVKVIPKRPPFPHPPPLNFESVPVSQRSMTLEAAQWSLTSEQLQELVSHAIRKSAEESFIRLVSLKTFDEELPAELERLSTLQATTQAQYRFKMHRRAMLLQSLNALSFNQSTETNDGEALANLTTQLAELTISCDRLMETLISVADQRAQLQHMQDVHVSSALAMGLRKLNASYGKRKTELKVTRAELDELKAELRDAWLVAEDMAQEMDDLDNFPRDDFESAGDDSASLAGGRLTTSSVESAQVVEVTGTAVASTATLASLPPVEDSDRAGRVSAARKRSVRVSNLRLHGLSVADGAAGPSPRGRKPSLSTKISGLSVIQVDTASLSEGSFLEMAETRPATPASAVTLDMPPAPVPPVPPLPTLGSSMSVDALDIPYSKPPLSSPGFDRSFIPPDTQAFPTPHTPGHELSFGQRIQSLNLNLSAEATSKLKSLLGMRRSKSENRPAMRRADSAKANRFSAPLRAVGEVILPADTHTTEDPACGPACAAAGDER